MKKKRLPSAAQWAAGVPDSEQADYSKPADGWAPEPSYEHHDPLGPEPTTGAKPVPKSVFTRFKIIAGSVNFLAFATVLGTGFGAYRALGADFSKQIDERIDGGMKVISAQVEALKQRQDALVDESRRFQHEQERVNEHTSKALEVIMDRLGVAESKRPEPVSRDGGR